MLGMVPRKKTIVRYTAFLAMLLSWSSCEPNPPPSVEVRDPVLRDELLRRVGVDQTIRDTFAFALRTTGTVPDDVVRQMLAVDSSNLAWLRPLIDSVGLPSRQAVGPEGIDALLLLIQHADSDPEFQARMLRLVERGFRSGDIEGQELAMLTDRVLKAQHQPQRYGTQATIEGGVVRIDPIDDSTGVDERRAELGLPPLHEYKRVLDSVYGRAPRSTR